MAYFDGSRQPTKDEDYNLGERGKASDSDGRDVKAFTRREEEIPSAPEGEGDQGRRKKERDPRDNSVDKGAPGLEFPTCRFLDSASGSRSRELPPAAERKKR